MKLFKILSLVAIYSLLVPSTQPKIIHIPADSSSIQAGINGSVNGDTVLVDRGTYHEKINFLGRNIFLTSSYLFDKDTNTINNTIISGDSAGTVVTFNSSEENSAVLYGFTITKGFKGSWIGAGGILCERTSPQSISPTISHNRIIDNVGSTGGGIALYGSSARIINNIIARNKADQGAGIAACEGQGEILGNLIAQNEASGWGGGICFFFYESLVLINNTICSNKAVSGGAIACYEEYDGGASHLFAKDNIIAYNSAPEGGAVFRGIYCTINSLNNIFWDNGVQPYAYFEPDSTNIVTENPGLVHPDSGNYRLVKCSPCIDRGDTLPPNLLTVDLDGNPRIATFCDSMRIDLGAYELVNSSPIIGDIDRNCIISVSDAVMLINYLFRERLPKCLLAADVNCDGRPTVSDVIYLINYLFKGGTPPCKP